MRPDASQHRLERLRGFRNKPETDLSLGFLKDAFKREVERPYKQLAAITEVWARLVPEPLARHARLESLQRGVLRVAVSSSAHLYELDRLLRDGLQQRLIIEHRGPAIRKVQLHVAEFNDPAAER